MLLSERGKSASRPTARDAPRMASLSAPMRGLRLDVPVTAVGDGHALRLDDWVVKSDGLHVRKGVAVVTEEHGGAITALMGYPGHVFAATASEIFDGQASAVSGLSGGAWESALIANHGGLHMLAVNGINIPRHFDGLTWHTASITGADASKWHAIVSHQRRIFAAEKNSLRVWYLGLSAIGGPASPIYLEAQCQRGGEIAALATLQPSGGRSPEAQLVIATTGGELIIYVGTDPDVASEWRLVGVWDIPRPRGRRAFVNVGVALALLTDKGLLPLPRVLAAAESGQPVESLSGAIDPALDAGTVQAVESASSELLMLAGAAHQWVLSEGAWTRFTGLPTATVWAEMDGALYAGTGDGKVLRYTGDTDDGAPIRAFAVDGYRLKRGRQKQFSRIRPTYSLAHPYVPRIELLLDYREPPASFDAANVDDRYWLWSDVTWPKQPMQWMRDTSSRLQPWRSVAGRGEVAALMMSMQSRTPVIWTGFDLVYSEGGFA